VRRRAAAHRGVGVPRASRSRSARRSSNRAAALLLRLAASLGDAHALLRGAPALLEAALVLLAPALLLTALFLEAPPLGLLAGAPRAA